MSDEMLEQYIMKITKEISCYVSPEVNWIEACAIYIEKHDIDAETFANIVHQSPFLLSKVTESARSTNCIDVDYAVLPI